ncbi:hypothetical protein [Streptococcus oricebi]|uniref:Flagellar FliJ protein n=1 Tax=Streptococcus oricebi TaxID=1547447 RepID=A0ABS5B378_9STRE|nr:hypothetical protein [Streptococcus oricebi]MBP2623290.1 hypothetical protein [Streptococcus oricebi]
MLDQEGQRKLRKFRRNKKILDQYKDHVKELERISQESKLRQQQVHGFVVAFRDAFIDEARRRGDKEFEQNLNNMVKMSQETALLNQENDETLESTKYYFDEEEQYLNYQISKLEAEEAEEDHD